jgi:hypothetical protein
VVHNSNDHTAPIAPSVVTALSTNGSVSMVERHNLTTDEHIDGVPFPVVKMTQR